MLCEAGEDLEKRRQAIIKRKRVKMIALIKRIIGYIIMVGVVGGCHYMVLVVSANSAAEETQTWATNFLRSLGQDMVVGQILKVLMTVVSLRLIARTTNINVRRVLKLMIDQVVARAIAMSSVKNDLPK